MLSRSLTRDTEEQERRRKGLTRRPASNATRREWERSLPSPEEVLGMIAAREPNDPSKALVSRHDEPHPMSTSIAIRRASTMDQSCLKEVYGAMAKAGDHKEDPTDDGGIRHLQHALSVSAMIVDEPLRKSAENAVLGSLGSHYNKLKMYEKSREHLLLALKVCRGLGNKQVESSWQCNLGIAYEKLGQLEEAIERYWQSILICQEIGDRKGEGNRHGNLASAYYVHGQFERSVEHYTISLAILRDFGDRKLEEGWYNGHPILV
tara:strand:+ start:253 stop:1044 length:792 start_codon:yes stop_codon:yes gene_type:complete